MDMEQALGFQLGKPVRITLLAPGSGNFVPETVGNIAFIEQCGGGNGGNRGKGADRTGGAGGAAASSYSRWVTLTKASYAYSVGAKGLGATVDNTFGTLGQPTHFDGVATPGGGPVGALVNLSDFGGQAGSTYGSSDTAGAIILVSGFGVSGGASGGGGSSSDGANGAPVGYSNPSSSFQDLGGSSKGVKSGADYSGGGGGGSSLFGYGGKGGDGNSAGVAFVGLPADGFGGGGGGGGCGSVSAANGGDGTDGMIRITEWRTA